MNEDKNSLTNETGTQQKNRKPVIGAAGALVVAIAGYLGYDQGAASDLLAALAKLVGLS